VIGLIVGSVAVAVVGERLMDPDARAWLRARARARRIRKQRSARRPEKAVRERDQMAMLHEGLAARRRSWAANMRGGFLGLAAADERTIEAIERKIEHLERGAS
jgi:hypothetical protein